jgi:L-ribulose-5-phosphate 4-epimerase
VLDAPHESFIEVDYEGKQLSSTLKPSKDLPVHLDIYKLCPQVKAIVHTHSPVATSYSVFAKEIPLLTVVSKKLTHLPVLEVDGVGRDQQGKIIAQHLNESHTAGILMRNHGVLATGESISKAQKLAELIELTAKIALNSRLMSQ